MSTNKTNKKPLPIFKGNYFDVLLQGSESPTRVFAGSKAQAHDKAVEKLPFGDPRRRPNQRPLAVSITVVRPGNFPTLRAHKAMLHTMRKAGMFAEVKA